MAKLNFDILAATLVSPNQCAEGKAVYAALLLQALSQPPVDGRLVASHSSSDLAIGLNIPDATAVRCLDALVKGRWIEKTSSGDYSVGVVDSGEYKFHVSDKPVAEAAPKKPSADEQLNAMLAQLRKNKTVSLMSRISVAERKATLGVSTKKTPVARIVDIFEQLVATTLHQPFQRVLDAGGAPSIRQDYIYAKRFLSYAKSESEAVNQLRWLVANWETFVRESKWLGPCNLQVVGSVRGYTELQRLRSGARVQSAGDRYSGGKGDSSGW